MNLGGGKGKTLLCSVSCGVLWCLVVSCGLLAMPMCFFDRLSADVFELLMMHLSIHALCKLACASTECRRAAKRLLNDDEKKKNCLKSKSNCNSRAPPLLICTVRVGRVPLDPREWAA